MNIKKLLIVGMCLLAGQVHAKRCPNQVSWPWAHEWACAKKVMVTNTQAAGQGSFSWAVDECNASEVPVHITFCMAKDDRGYSAERECWIFNMVEKCVITNKVWIDGFSQKCSKPNSKEPSFPNNACWAIEFAGGTTSKPDSCGFDFQEGSDGSVVSGVCMCLFKRDKGWLSAIRTQADNITVCGMAMSTDNTGDADQPNTCSILDVGSNNCFGVEGMCEARSIWGGLGSSGTKEGALMFKGHGAQYCGGTLGVRRCGSGQLNSGAEIGIAIDIPLGASIGPDVTLNGILATGFSECIVYAPNFEEVCIEDSCFGSGCHDEGEVKAQVCIRAENMNAGIRGNLKITKSTIDSAEKALEAGLNTLSPLGSVVMNECTVGSRVPNKDNIEIAQTELVEIVGTSLVSATEGNGLTLGKNLAVVSIEDTHLDKNAYSGLYVKTAEVNSAVPYRLVGGTIDGNGGAGVTVELTPAMSGLFIPSLDLVEPVTNNVDGPFVTILP